MYRNETATRKRYSHLSHGDRSSIEALIAKGESFRAIGAYLGKSPSTIAREVKSHSYVIKSRGNDCANLKDCYHKGVCGKKNCSAHLCKRCNVPCKKHCPDYVQIHCDRVQKPPYVCNGCEKIHRCTLTRRVYNYKKADAEYRDMLVNRRSGFDLNYEQISKIDELVSPLIRKGQSLYHIKQVYGDKLPVSESTLRKLIANCELSARNIDLRNQVRRKPRKKRAPQLHNEVITTLKEGRKYTDYLQYIGTHEVHTVQMDCVEGKKEDSAVLLTLHFPQFCMQLAYIMDEHTSACVVGTLDKLEDALGSELFKQMFPVILTDNGHEFMDISGMERSINGGQRTKVFFCEPNRSDQKGACENNHRYIRYVIRKGTSMEPYNQNDINLMMNHINSYCRRELSGQSAYDCAMNVMPEDFFTLLGLEKISPAEVDLTPSLLSKKRKIFESK